MVEKIEIDYWFVNKWFPDVPLRKWYDLQEALDYKKWFINHTDYEEDDFMIVIHRKVEVVKKEVQIVKEGGTD